MRFWESSSHTLSTAEAYVALDALQYKATHGLFTSQTKWNHRPNRYDKLAAKLEAHITDSTQEIEAKLTPRERFLGRRAVECALQFPRAVLHSMAQEGYAEDISVSRTVDDSQPGPSNEHVQVALRSGSRPYNIVFLAAQALEHLGAHAEIPENPYLTFTSFSEAVEQAA